MPDKLPVNDLVAGAISLPWVIARDDVPINMTKHEAECDG
jgi:hypothetical protein